MKNLLILLVLVGALTLKARHLRMNISQAMALKKIKVQVTGTGGHSGYCISLLLSNTSPDSLILDFDPGLKFNSLNDQDQDILLVKKLTVPLKHGEQKKVFAKGYCCQATKHSPGNKSLFKVEANKDSNLILVARFLDQYSFDPGVEQQAVWSISDGSPTGSIFSENIASLRNLRSLVAGLKNEEDPWYSYESAQHIYSNGVIAIMPLKLTGLLKYNSPSLEFTTLEVLNDAQVPVCMIKSGWLKPGSNEEFPVDIDIRGLQKGRYSVQLRTKEKVLVCRHFQI